MHDAVMSEGPYEPQIVAFLCNWCSYAGADQAGTSRMQYPQNVRIIRVPCSGRVDPLFVVKALQRGADGVMVLGCHPGDCHYQQGNYFAQRRFALLHRLLEFTGIESDRLMVEWVSASEGKEFARTVTQFTDRVRALGPGPFGHRRGSGAQSVTFLKSIAAPDASGEPVRSTASATPAMDQACGCGGAAADVPVKPRAEVA